MLKFAKDNAAIIVPLLYSFIFLLIYVYEGTFNNFFNLRFSYVNPTISLIVGYSLVSLVLFSTLTFALIQILFFPSIRSLKYTWWLRVLIIFGIFLSFDHFAFKLTIFWFDVLPIYLIIVSSGYIYYYLIKRSWLKLWKYNLGKEDALTKECFLKDKPIESYLITKTYRSPVLVFILFIYIFLIYRYAGYAGYRQAETQTKFQVLKDKPWMFLINEYDGTYYFKNWDSKKMYFW